MENYRFAAFLAGTRTSRIQVHNVTATLTASFRRFLWCQSRSINIICTAYGEKSRLEFSHLQIEKTADGTMHLQALDRIT
jgi:hypothetical protein